MAEAKDISLNRNVLDFERPILELENKIKELRELASIQDVGVEEEMRKLTDKANKMRKDIYSRLTTWQKVQLARHPSRPYLMDYIEAWTDDFQELHGDRAYGDDHAVIGGLLKIHDRRVMLIGHQKGRSTKEKIYHNFGMPHPEGYRKAKRLFRMAEKFGLPVVTLIDTPGAYPGIGAEERGQSEAIAENLKVMAGLRVPMISVIIGEGGSGGALALGVTDRILMLEYSIYSVISPEGCAAILWQDQSKVEEAAEALKLTTSHLESLGVVDRVISEPPGGAHRNPVAMAEELGRVIYEELEYLARVDPDTLVEKRLRKYLAMGFFEEESP